jgi:hypothetical protein
VIWLGGSIADLNTYLPPGSGWTLTEATAINDNDQIVGYGFHDGVERGFLMAIPEPTSAMLALCGFAAVGAIVKSCGCDCQAAASWGLIPSMNWVP